MQCETCTFFNAADHECRRYAPQPSDRDRKAEWPTVAATDWCGEYREDPARAARKSASA